MKIRMLILAGFIIHNSLVRAQCCSPGNPVGGTSSLSILAKRSIRFIGFYRYGYSDTYYQGTKPIPFHLVSSANYNYAGSIISYGVTNMFNVETELGYFLNRTQEYGLAPPYMVRGYGLSNAVVSAKYNLINNKAKNWEWTTAAGGKIPFAGQPQAVNNVELPLDVQPSTNAFGIVVQSFLYKGYVHRALHFFSTAMNTILRTQKHIAAAAPISLHCSYRNLSHPFGRGYFK
ncbi:MAG: hypothetical protein ACE5DN_02600 [Flavobacteriales bacterium]